jgi:hypothetical protein
MSRTAKSSAVAALLAGVFVGVPAAAETATTFVVKRDAYCGEPSCSVAFAKTPAGKRMEIENVSCHVSSTAGAVIINAFIHITNSLNAEAFRFYFSPPGKLGEQYNQASFVANYAGRIPVTANLTPNISFYTMGGTFVRMNCAMSGRTFTP